MTAILGISAFYHDSAAALLVDGQIIAAAQEERFSRHKHDEEFPTRAIAYCLEEAGLCPQELSYVGFYDKPFLKFDRLLQTYLAVAPSGLQSFLKSMPVWLKGKLRLPRQMRRALRGYERRFVFAEHHESHAASAFFPSPFDQAAILTLDGVGEWATASCGVGRGNRIELERQLRFPHSLGLLYSAFTYYCGFRVNDGEYKLMGLAPYGEPRFKELIVDHLIDLKSDGSFRLDMTYFNYCQGLTMTSRRFHDLFGATPRQPEGPLRQRDMDLAASIQVVTEEIVLRMARDVHRRTGLTNLCLAGGVALNCVANGRLAREGPFDEIWIQPAAGDAGGALGVAQFIWHQLLGEPRVAQVQDQQQGSRLGPRYDDETIKSYLDTIGANYERVDDEELLLERVAAAIAAGEVVGWFDDRMEYGPRALGSRSLLADARRPEMQSLINRKVKFREGFRPFAPVVLEEHAHEYFAIEPGQASPYMLLVAPVCEAKRLTVAPEVESARGLDKLKQARSEIPAVTHVDHSARIQTVDAERHGRLHKLLRCFYSQHGCPVLINTSFNLGWEPIVCTPEDAYRTFMSSEIDLLCLGSFLVSKPSRGAAPARVGSGACDPVLDSLLESPCCRSELERSRHGLVCRGCGHVFGNVGDGIAGLYWPHDRMADAADVTERVQTFYEATPFPNYDDHDSLRSLIEKSRLGRYARRLDETIPYDSVVLDAGCGTGQLTNFLGISCRQVVGTDICLNSLRLGEVFRREHGLERVRFAQMNLFRPAFRPEAFDVVLCTGVLHHTSDPHGGLVGLLPLVKPGGHLILGLYNTFGRLLTDLRRQWFRLTGGRVRSLDPVLRRGGLSEAKRRAWFEDQYRHPHESKHTFGEVLGWFDTAGLEFVRGVPALTPDGDGLDGSSLFEPQLPGNALDHLVVQAGQIFGSGQKEGGLFIMIAKKPAEKVAHQDLEAVGMG